jgi:hypothetical protein
MKQPNLEERVTALETQVVQLLGSQPADADTHHLAGMAQPTLEERVAALEKHVVQLLARPDRSPQTSDWRSTIGMFANDPVMQEIQAEGQRIREEDRRRTLKELDAADRQRRKAKHRRARQ